MIVRVTNPKGAKYYTTSKTNRQSQYNRNYVYEILHHMSVLGDNKTVGSIWSITKRAIHLMIFLRVSKTKFLKLNRFLQTSSLRVINFYDIMQPIGINRNHPFSITTK